MAGTFNLYPSQPLLTRTANGSTVGDFAIDRIIKRPGPGILTPLDE
jgi:hypothetical protein